MGTDIIRLIFLGINSWIMTVTMTTSHLVTSRDIIFGLNFLNTYTFLR